MLEEIIKQNGTFNFLGNISETFSYNLKIIDKKFPEIFSKMLLYKYVHSFSDLKNFPECTDNLDIRYKGGENKQLLKSQIIEFLFLGATGMLPGKKWDGKRNCDGFLVLNKDRDLITYNLHNQEKEQMLKSYLFNKCHIDKPSSKNAGSEYSDKINKIIFDESENKYKLYLNFQIRVR